MRVNSVQISFLATVNGPKAVISRDQTNNSTLMIREKANKKAQKSRPNIIPKLRPSTIPKLKDRTQLQTHWLMSFKCERVDYNFRWAVNSQLSYFPSTNSLFHCGNEMLIINSKTRSIIVTKGTELKIYSFFSTSQISHSSKLCSSDAKSHLVCAKAHKTHTEKKEKTDNNDDERKKTSEVILNDIIFPPESEISICMSTRERWHSLACQIGLALFPSNTQDMNEKQHGKNGTKKSHTNFRINNARPTFGQSSKQEIENNRL